MHNDEHDEPHDGESNRAQEALLIIEDGAVGIAGAIESLLFALHEPPELPGVSFYPGYLRAKAMRRQSIAAIAHAAVCEVLALQGVDLPETIASQYVPARQP